MNIPFVLLSLNFWCNKGHFKQGSKKQGPMKSSIPIGQEVQIGPKAFRQGFKTKINQIVI